MWRKEPLTLQEVLEGGGSQALLGPLEVCHQPVLGSAFCAFKGSDLSLTSCL